MTPELRELIEELREVLKAGQPSNMSWACSRPPASRGALAADLPASVRDLHHVVDGLLAGVFDIPPAEALPDIQYHLATAPAFTPIPTDSDGWFVLGALSDEPLFLNRETGSIWLFPWTGDEWYMRDEFHEIAPDLDSFLRYYVFGPGYTEIGSDDDRWHAFLDEQGLLEEGGE